MSNIKYYCSGWNKEIGFPQDLISYLKMDIKSLEKLVFIPSDFSNKEKIERNTTNFVDTFEKGNFNFKSVVVLTENMSKEEMHDHIVTANLVFLMGGNPSVQLEIINSFDLENAIRKTKAVIMGMSAGAMCMSKFSMLLPVNVEYPNFEIRRGMNLTGISIYPHYNSNGEVPEILTIDNESTKKIDLLHASNKYGPIYLLSDNSEIREENGILEFIGNGIIYLKDDKFELISKENHK